MHIARELVSWFLGAQVGIGFAGPRSVAFDSGAATLDVTLERPSALSPSFRVALNRSLDASVGSRSGRATFSLTTLRLEGCPIQWRLTPALRLLPCALADGGMLSADGRDVAEARSRHRPWWSAGISGRLSIGATSPRVDIEAGLIAPLYRDTFRFASGEVVYETPALIPFVSAGLSFGVGGS